MRRYAERFLTQHRRQLQKKDGFYEFIVPDVLQGWKLDERVRNATFDRDLAIRRSDAAFLALGHPVVDAMLEYAGSYEFGGLTAVRRIPHPELAGQSGYFFLFVVRQRIANEAVDECLFHFHPVFVGSDQQVSEEAAAASTLLEARDEAASGSLPASQPFFDIAKQSLENKIGLWDWEDDVEFLGLSWVEFLKT